MAERLSGGDPTTFLEVLIQVIDSGLVKTLRSELDKHGLTIDEVMEMKSRVAVIESDHRAPSNDLADETKDYVKRLFLASFDEGQIAAMLDLEPGRVEWFFKNHRIDSTKQKVIEMHLAGKTPKEISERVGRSRDTVVKTVRAFGQEPNRERQRTTGDDRERIRQLRADGKTYGEIEKLTGCDYYQVRSVCRKLREDARERHSVA